MPIKIDTALPARGILEMENIFVMGREHAMSQDIRPLRIVILNLMPTKIETETQLLRLLSNTPLQVEVELLQMATHESKNTSQEHLLQFYKTFGEIRHERFDGMIVTGAPVEHLPFEEVDYWPELCEIFAWTKRHVWSTFYICWGAQAGLYYHHGVPKYPLEKKISGVFAHRLLDPNHPCCGASTTSTGRRTPATRKCAGRISTPCRSCSCSPGRRRPGCTWSATWSAAASTPPATPSTTAKPWRMSTSATSRRAWISTCPAIITPKTTHGASQ